jgi:hypothetical protein
MTNGDNAVGHNTSSTVVDDLSLAKQALFEGGFTLIAAKNGKVLFRSQSHGVSDMLAMIDELRTLTEGACLADSVVGRAAALLCVYSKIAAVYGAKMSEGAVSILKAKGIGYELGTLVPKILNRDKSDICPYDRAVLATEDPNVALESLKALKLK